VLVASTARLQTPLSSELPAAPSARRGAGSVEPGTQVLEGSPAPQSAVAPHGTHAVRQRAARQQLWPLSRRVTL